MWITSHENEIKKLFDAHVKTLEPQFYVEFKVELLGEVINLNYEGSRKDEVSSESSTINCWFRNRRGE